MYLKKVHMKNFKSYGTRSMKVKLSKGLTVISGPNGSGKSNITDAIDFVLSKGRSAKALRAKNYAGLVFDGGEKGRASKTAEVQLVFDNSDRQLNINSDEVSFTKRLKVKNRELGPDMLNTTTYYYINGRSSSNGEFRNLFKAARLATHGYNIVKQGTVNNIAEKSTPTERRKIIDDISGITSLDEDINRSNNRKDKVDASLEKLDFFMKEINSSLRALNKERKNAKKHHEYKEKIKECKATLAHSKKASIEKSIKEISGNIQQCEVDIVNSKKGIDGMKRHIYESEKLISELELKIEDMQDDETKKLVEEIRSYKLEVSKAQDRKFTSEDKIEELVGKIAERKEDITKGMKELKTIQEEHDSIFQNKEEQEKIFKKYDDEYRSLSEEISLASEKFSELEEVIRTLKKELEGIEKEEAKLQIKGESLLERLGRKQDDMRLTEDSIKSVKLEIKDISWQIDDREKKKLELNTKKQKSRNKHIKEKQELLRIKKEEQRIAQNISKLNKEFQELRINKRAAEASGYGLAITKVLDARDEGELKGIHGTIAQLASVDNKYEIALSTAAGGRMQAIVTDDDESAARAIKFLKKKQFGRAMFLPLNKMMSGRPGGRALMVSENEGVMGFAIDLVKFEARYRNAFWYVFQDTLIVRNLETARKNMGGVRLVTLDGQITEKSGAMIGGSQQRKLIKFGKSEDSKYEEVRKTLDMAKLEQGNIIERSQEIMRTIGSASDNMGGINQSISKLDVEISAFKVALKDFEHRLQEHINIKDGFSKEIKDIQGEIEGNDKEIKTKTDTATKMRGEIDSQENTMLNSLPEARQKRMETLKAEKERLSEEIREFRSNLETISTKINLYNERLDEKKEATDAEEKEIVKLKEIIKQAEIDIVENGKEVEKRVDVEKKLLGEIGQLEKELTANKENIMKRRYDISKERDRIESKRHLLIQYNTNIANLNAGLEDAIRRIEIYGITIEPPYPTQREIEKEIDQYNNKLELLGPVNMVAVEKYDLEKRKKDDYQAKYDQLKAERKALMKMVRDIKKEKKAKFMEVFNSINEHFQVIYPKISKGGEGFVALENENEPFQGGLIIKARPPGEKLRDIRFISGGEKSQVAIAFILSLQHYDPSPLYILDEIDQNLDRVNSEIIIKSIQRYSRKAQFILITLHKDMISYADSIYGCYRKGGVSEMVALQNIQDIPKTDGDDAEEEKEDNLEERAEKQPENEKSNK